MINLENFRVFMQMNPNFLYLSIFLISFLECFAIIGIFLPGIVMLFIVTVLAGSLNIEFWKIGLLGYLGAFLGDISSYFIGFYFNKKIYTCKYWNNNWYESAQSFFNRYGILSLFIGRFIGVFRPILPMISGMLNMPAKKFITISSISSIPWTIVYLIPGWSTGYALGYEKIINNLFIQAGIIISIIIFICLLIVNSFNKKVLPHILFYIAASIIVCMIHINLESFYNFDYYIKNFLIVQSYTYKIDFFTNLIIKYSFYYIITMIIIMILIVIKNFDLNNTFFIFNSLFTTFIINALLHNRYKITIINTFSTIIFTFFVIFFLLTFNKSKSYITLFLLFIHSIIIPCIISLSFIYEGIYRFTEIILKILIACISCNINFYISKNIKEFKNI